MSDITAATAMGFGAGIYFFFKGFRIYREYRVLADTPEMPIRSIAMGLTHVHGKAVGDQTTVSPVSKTPCYFYKVDVDVWESSGKSSSWKHYRSDATGVPFYLEDATGKVLVDAHLAEYDLIQTIKREAGGGGSGFGRLFGGIGGRSAAATTSLATDGDLISYAESLASTGGGGSSILGSISSMAVRQTVFSLSVGNLNLGGGGSRRYRFTEYCILPEHWYDVTGTCIENPSPRDEHDRNMILKGQNEPTFLISWRAEKEIEKTLRNRALLYIFGGAALSVVCLGILLARFGWL